MIQYNSVIFEKSGLLFLSAAGTLQCALHDWQWACGFRSTVAGGDMYAGQHMAAGDMYRGQPALAAASYQGYIISKDAVNAAAAAASVPPVSSIWYPGECSIIICGWCLSGTTSELVISTGLGLAL